MSRILVAVSDDSDPNGTWYFTAINSKTTIGGSDGWADYPGLAVDEEAIYITANMFRFNGPNTNLGSRLWIINKAPFYTGGVASVAIYDPVGALAPNTFNVNIAPAHVFGTGASLPGGGASTFGTWLVGYNGISDGVNEYLQIIAVDNPLGVPVFTLANGAALTNVGNIDPAAAALPSAPQPTSVGGITNIATNDRRSLQTVWRNGNLYTCFEVEANAAPDVGADHRTLGATDDGSSTNPAFADRGNVGGENIQVGAFTYFPALAVNQFDDMAVGFALSGSTTFAGGYYASRKSGDAPGSTSPAVVFAPGLTPYQRTFGGRQEPLG